MKRNWLKIGMTAGLAAVMCWGAAGCQNSAREPVETPAEVVEENDEIETAPKVDYIYEVKQHGIEFYPAPDKETLREPLVRLLENTCVMVPDEIGDGADFAPPYPDRPSIAYGHWIGLFDFDFDGTPELVVNQGGGSSGNASYTVYDLLSGEELVYVDGGFYQNFAAYFNRDSGVYEVLVNYSLRFGWTGYASYVTRVHTGESVSFNGKQLKQTEILSAHYRVDAIATPPTEEDKANDLEGYWLEYCAGTDFYVDGKSASVEEYLCEKYVIDTYRVLVPETRMQEIFWPDVVSDDDDALTRAEKMADALLSTDQRYVKP